MEGNVADPFVDVDFTQDPRYVFGDLGPRRFGAPLERFADNVQVIPEGQWKELIAQQDAEGGLDKLVTRIMDQGREGSCVANAFSQAIQIVLAQQLGKENVIQLSPISLYKRIGRSPSSGAMLDDGIEESNKRGILPLDTPENRAKFGEHVMPATGFHERYPDGWEETAKKFRAVEWFVCDSVNELVSAQLQGMPVVVGRQGHSICYAKITYRNGAMVDKYANSWSPQWGDGGFGYDTLSQIRMSSNWAVALRSVVVN